MSELDLKSDQKTKFARPECVKPDALAPLTGCAGEADLGPPVAKQ